MTACVPARTLAHPLITEALGVIITTQSRSCLIPCIRACISAACASTGAGADAGASVGAGAGAGRAGAGRAGASPGPRSGSYGDSGVIPDAENRVGGGRLVGFLGTVNHSTRPET